MVTGLADAPNGGVEPRLSVIVPTLNEGDHLPRLLSDLSAIPASHEVIVVDGGSGDRTTDIARTARAIVIDGPAGRGSQLRRGAESARAPLLCFLHADIRLSTDAVELLASLAHDPPAAACVFRLRIDSPGMAYRIIERGANLRTRAVGLPYGDQGLIVGRPAYEAVGGYPPIPLMEDVVLARALRSSAGIRLLPASVLVSARRWERDGPVRRTVKNLTLLARFLTGTPPERLVRRYGPKTSRR